jgi:hypothetical protein
MPHARGSGSHALTACTDAKFDTRSACISCSGTELRTVWDAAFGDEPVRTFLAASEYSEDVNSYFAVPNCSGIDTLRTLDQFNLVHPLEHINVFEPNTLSEFCRRAGFVPIPRRPAHVTSRLADICKTEASRFITRPTTNQYFRWAAA